MVLIKLKDSTLNVKLMVTKKKVLQFFLVHICNIIYTLKEMTIEESK